jgi:hypothetical protein
MSGRGPGQILGRDEGYQCRGTPVAHRSSVVVAQCGMADQEYIFYICKQLRSNEKP